MKKNILAIGIISLFIGIAVLPMCSASTASSVLSTNENDSDQKPLFGPFDLFYIKAQVEGTVKGLHQERIFGVHANGPIDLIVKALRGRTDNINVDQGSWSFSARFVKWDTDPQLVDPGQEIYYIKGTVYLCRIYLIEG